MLVSAGTRLGPYEILSALGAGGMGEVYRARDTKLNRDVALKVLPEAFASDAERMARFKREAQVLASLNHPHIAAIYGFEDSGSTHALVLELVEGPTLADRIAQGPIPLDEALPIARQIAEALEAAHEKGVIHRDLKPANIKVTADGAVKVLDFGLAKMLETPAAPAALTMSPTLSVHATYAGVILGTAAYMSPEQARGKAVDKRTDIWAFGCVLYEMLTGVRPFAGEDVAEVLGAVIHKEVAWAALPTRTPPTVLARCLAKDPKQRIRDIGDVLLALNGAFDSPGSAADRSARSRRPSVVQMLAGVAAMLLAVGAAVGLTWWKLRPTPPQPVRFTIEPPATQPLTIQGASRDLAVTFDGRQLVYRTGPPGQTIGAQLAVRALDQLDARLLPGITGMTSPFVSPDGHWIGFFGGANGELKKVSILGGPPITLCKYVGVPREASWGPDDTIIFATNDPSTGLLSVSAGGGDPQVLTTPDTAHGEADHVLPFTLPGGRAVLFTVTMQGQPIDSAQIAVLDRQTGRTKTVLRGGSDARYVDTGHLVYAVGGTLRAVRFNLAHLEVTSDPVPVLEQVTMSAASGAAEVALSQTGTLAYVPGGGRAAARTLVWVTRQGHEDAIKAPPRAYAIPRIAPDGTRVALDIRDQESDIWVWDLSRETLSRLTFDAGADQNPVWTPDSRRLIFSSTRGGGSLNLYSQPADNTGSIERLSTSPNTQLPSSISPDGSRVLFTELAPKTKGDVVMLTLQAAGTSAATTPATRPTTATRLAVPLLQTPFTEMNAEISPDGRWVAYQSNESGADQVYVRPFPTVESGQRQISTGGGTRPMWARSGRELFYEANGTLMAVAVQPTGTTFNWGNPAKLFDIAPYYFAPVSRMYDVSADGQRFLLIKPTSTAGSTAPPPHVVVVEHWTEELMQRVPTK